MGTKAKQRKKRARRERNRIKEIARRERKHVPRPRRKIVTLHFRGGITLSYDLTDAVRIPWDGKTQATKEEAVVQLWEDQGTPTAGCA